MITLRPLFQNAFLALLIGYARLDTPVLNSTYYPNRARCPYTAQMPKNHPGFIWILAHKLILQQARDINIRLCN